ncbi:MAG: hypothetical protein COZ49_03575 [Candidatus Yonathbacteria bacterium CG_4_10_14_3_um_filter_47_65]|uniref:Uncharacterized protein n=2 Tax=Parcubacteria group TaxID=1794811 RepID=A0A2M8D780_9BACT|nr:MAG: hypothetical protein AUJ44_01425 [Candidatus Nomurabacteria bacterium CG1_02_47_685]PIP03463.1 MAG: hypothetical protein COX54_03410 [Candidatus Yonathbacteria bacterium CG23_combo_of_CG06-09_8_20_14_all_46_18]PIQ32972.1 MAG: hypothetical protein COW61_00680 [Candidatus Yonathbacteria bacterium CG17_big_fil_post_rev_8_21_14_2_50_46_19]PIX56193.1 MAG: hypothetical protein COZ49_03575 [Candidatus Yonathbacteria bacterium CG_4_10_14_3_um_filter_47_65]PIY57663.1 MAG: hypothetical protein CO
MPADLTQKINTAIEPAGGVSAIKGLRTYARDLKNASGGTPSGAQPTKIANDTTELIVPTYAPPKPRPQTLTQNRDHITLPDMIALKPTVSMPIKPKPTPVSMPTLKQASTPNVIKKSADGIKKMPAITPASVQTASIKTHREERDLQPQREEKKLTEPEKLKGEIEELEATRKEAAGQLENTMGEKSRLESVVKKLSEEKTGIVGRLNVIVEREKDVESKVEKTEEQEAGIKTPDERKRVQLERRKIEDERRKIEEERWSIEEELKQLTESLEENNIALQKTIAQKNTLETLIARTEKDTTRKKLEIELIIVSKKKAELEEQWLRLMEGKEQLDAKLRPVVESEVKVKAQKRDADKRERATALPGERRKIEEERWITEGERRKIEEERWGIEGEIKEELEKMADLRPAYQDATKKEKELMEMIAKLS